MEPCRWFPSPYEYYMKRAGTHAPGVQYLDPNLVFTTRQESLRQSVNPSCHQILQQPPFMRGEA